MEQSGNNRATHFLIQKIAFDVQHGNVASVMATIPINTGLGRVCLSSHSLNVKTFLFFYLVKCCNVNLFSCVCQQKIVFF